MRGESWACLERLSLPFPARSVPPLGPARRSTSKRPKGKSCERAVSRPEPLSFVSSSPRCHPLCSPALITWLSLSPPSPSVFLSQARRRVDSRLCAPLRPRQSVSQPQSISASLSFHMMDPLFTTCPSTCGVCVSSLLPLTSCRVALCVVSAHLTHDLIDGDGRTGLSGASACDSHTPPTTSSRCLKAQLLNS